MAAFDAFLELDGIKGETEDKQLPDHIELMSYSFGASQAGAFAYGGGGGAGKCQFQDFHFNKRCDKASTLLFLHCATGKHIKKATMKVRKASGKQEIYFKAEFTDVLVSSYTVSGQGSGDPIPTESISFNFDKLQLSYNLQKSDGTMAGFVDKFWSLKANQGSPV
ncbi:MAG: type VI secretion system tube protein Hcp [Bryobacterales bacterium]|nr:type VI secretion system tube protein Hcp [Bryobacterales bacterium]MBL8232392.1 type VI secretion system tube protein Hcp [Bryobacterales bacterium]